MRLDKFLKVSRIIKRRTVAADACDGHRVEVNGKVAKPSQDLKIGDVITVSFGDKKFSARVTRLAETVRKDDAEGLYEVIV